MKRMRVVHVINSFESGGAEAMLCNLVLRTDLERFEPLVVALIDNMSVAGPLLRAGIPIETMGMRAGIPDPLRLLRLASYLKRMSPDVVQTWMDHSNLIGALASRAVCNAHVVWGIHHSNHVPELTKRSTLATVWACAALSRHLPSRVVFCSEDARHRYSQRGFAPHKLVVIPNGFDTSRFCIDPEARQCTRRELGIPENVPLIGLAARYDPFKDHSNFLRAAAMLLKTHPSVHFLLCGREVTMQNPQLAAEIRSLGIGANCHLVGPRSDMPRINAALDIAASSSISEAFPLAVGEAMACGIPCVATDVGDSALIIGATGRVVPSKSPSALAAGWADLLALSPGRRRELGDAARKRVCEKFDLASVTRQYESLYRSLARPEHGEGRANRDATPLWKRLSPVGARDVAVSN